MKRVLSTALFFPIFAFSYELGFNKTFTKSINADTIMSNISISVEKPNEKSINIEIEKFNNFVKNTKNITIENSYYNLTPKYEYIDNKSVFKGYLGESRFTIKSEDTKKINGFLNDLIELKDSIKSNDLKLNVSNLSWELSNKLQYKMIDELRLEALIWIENYAKELSAQISKKCNVKSVNINEESSTYYPRARMQSSADSLQKSYEQEITPINNEQSIKINTNYILDCK
ncbi:SIMPL domain-containing protein [Aliarcobacter trophiarum LMG 25534]|uniref:SIMPL domain-containing protein n=1 Tax=Aliarcobacter trophiarum LMG 25534 TaxID=1032241 RepID=A0AAD0VL60_9BACT|nr:SIMPL domain-containing protein [Aliarcobacter trophiarum]AXK47928.1 SIMPL domain-containing protein [Aliarcobacter trophiarum LMG 25534]RXI28136.1 SIMPL domain-containing protein [Aliarcobacter trophiarum]RXJ92410.1 SIMPL domain-containing protein [Aliarcobacter trophiarum LMG 25534]